MKCELRRYVRLLLRLLDLQDSYTFWDQYCAFQWKISFEKSHALAFGLPILPLKFRLLAPSTSFSIVLISINDPKNILTNSNLTWFQKTCPLRRTLSQYCRYAVREGVRTNPCAEHLVSIADIRYENSLQCMAHTLLAKLRHLRLALPANRRPLFFKSAFTGQKSIDP